MEKQYGIYHMEKHISRYMNMWDGTLISHEIWLIYMHFGDILLGLCCISFLITLKWMFVVQFIELHDYAFKCINLISYMLIWVMFDCRHKLDQIGIKYHKLEGVKEKKRGAN